MRYTLHEILAFTGMVVVLVVILEHAGGFSQAVKATTGGYVSAVNALEGHGG